ncbi:hypothetical protein J6590_083007 [Homalodisca vitripennis]|nr:hypothetical protein J6590_083007 [Homalodisca vitripennis]
MITEVEVEGEQDLTNLSLRRCTYSTSPPDTAPSGPLLRSKTLRLLDGHTVLSVQEPSLVLTQAGDLVTRSNSCTSSGELRCIAHTLYVV